MTTRPCAPAVCPAPFTARVAALAAAALAAIVAPGLAACAPRSGAAAERGADGPGSIFASPRRSVSAAGPAAALGAPIQVTVAVDDADDGIPSCIGDGDPFDPDRLRSRVGELAAPERAGRAPGSAGDVATRRFVADRFACLGLAPGGDEGRYEQAFRDAGGRDTANVIGVLAGADPALAGERIIVGAHHDHLGESGERIYAGANDNASGVVALVALAEILAAARTPPRRTVVFVAFGAEEAPGDLEGSRHFVATAAAGADGLAHVVMMVNLDMVGSYDADGVVMALGTFRGLPGRAVVAAAAKTRPGLQVAMGGQGRGSDHEPFCAAGIPYVFFWTPGGRCYHATCDTAERVDVEHMAEIVALAAEVTGELAQTETDLVAAKAKHGCGGR